MSKSFHHQNIKALRPQLGFTLVELMVTVAVAVILLSIAVPSFVDVLRANKLSNDVNSIVQAIRDARNDAVAHGGSALCASANQTTCSSVTSDWVTGWIVVNSAGVVGVSDRPLTGMTITASGTAATYDDRGHLTPAGGSLTLTFCNGRTGVGTGRTITVSSAGLPTTTNYDSCT